MTLFACRTARLIAQQSSPGSAANPRIGADDKGSCSQCHSTPGNGCRDAQARAEQTERDTAARAKTGREHSVNAVDPAAVSDWGLELHDRLAH